MSLSVTLRIEIETDCHYVSLSRQTHLLRASILTRDSDTGLCGLQNPKPT